MFVLLAASRRATMYPYGVSMLHATYRCCYSTSSFPSVDVWSVLSSEVCTSDKNEIFIRPPTMRLRICEAACLQVRAMMVLATTSLLAKTMTM